MRGELTRGKLIAILAVGAVAFGAAAWLTLGPTWTVAGVLAGPLITFVVVAVRRAFTSPDAATLLDNDQPGEAIAQLRNEMPSWRTLAAKRPGKYAPDLADALDHQSRLLAADDRLAEALGTIQVAVRLYRNLAAAEPARFLPSLAECLTCEAGWLAEIELAGDALAAVHEATDICQDKLPWGQLPSCAARAMLLEGELLCGQARYREAARLLATGWRMAAGQQLQDVLRDATPAIRAAYRADPDHFAAVWQAETGAEPPDWLT